jgi:broad specificity phosphatase PhoE
MKESSMAVTFTRPARLLMPKMCGRICLVTTIYLVQHGDKERLPGDPGLTELGRRQAAVTARWLQGTGLQALYSSPLRRAQETAEPISRVTSLAVRVDSRLRERLNWDGTQTFEAFLADWGRSTKDRDLVLSNGESSRSAGERLRVFLADLAGGSGPVAVVSHGGVTVDLLRNLLGDDGLAPRLVDDHIPPCAITILDDLHVLGIAVTRHLTGL